MELLWYASLVLYGVILGMAISAAMWNRLVDSLAARTRPWWTQDELDAGTEAFFAYRKSGGDWNWHPTHAVHAALNASLSARNQRARLKGKHHEQEE